MAFTDGVLAIAITIMVLERLARTVQAVIGDNVDLAYVDQGYTAARVADAAAAHRITPGCPRQSGASFSCLAAGLSNVPSHGQPASVAFSMTMSVTPRHSPDSTSFLSLAS
ncbi:hypothetical protein A0J57_17040 [Sphingobium sp. 22B]|nr:hypothetical protein AXW74_12450 [Sphingobium sp. AM]KYC31149.1 hypothetical protein A0J57_17040 [Sphingobium sp. 22B]OAP31151.1 hypothetical protein A8O16_14945 [Sphingobium sp. 20006FA]